MNIPEVSINKIPTVSVGNSVLIKFDDDKEVIIKLDEKNITTCLNNLDLLGKQLIRITKLNKSILQGLKNV